MDLDKNEIISDREKALEKVKENGKLLDIVSEELKNDREIVFEEIGRAHV